MFLLMLIRGGVKKVVGHFVVGTTFFWRRPLWNKEIKKYHFFPELKTEEGYCADIVRS